MKKVKYIFINLCFFMAVNVGYSGDCFILSTSCGIGQPNDYYCVNIGGGDSCFDCGCYRDCAGNSSEQYCFA